ncbi:hypothetical protein [Polaromonas sp.]|uniref:hypothetical protein n=1 Tax=Polaromonas sp. TaxID=1869339 RepID=UPI002487B4E8|nr:hypothetical protein [Polaromonas sp.]MDI1272344.1 hypothetical protein [Polaromonas sp.]
MEQDWDGSPLRAYLLRDYWTPDGGLCLLAGFDYAAHIESAPFQPQWMHTLSPATLQGHYGQEADEVDDLLSRMNSDLDELRTAWAGCKRDSEAEDYSPTFFIEWALSKKFPPDWLEWAIWRGLYIPKQEADDSSQSDFDKASLGYPLELALDSQAAVGSTDPLPDVPAIADTETQAAPVNSDSITSKQVALFFDRLPYPADSWPKRLSDTKWLKPARISQGEVGGVTARWCPLILARLIHAREEGNVKQKTLAALNARFKKHTALLPWRDAWNEHYEMFTNANSD